LCSYIYKKFNLWVVKIRAKGDISKYVKRQQNYDLFLDSDNFTFVQKSPEIK